MGYVLLRQSNDVGASFFWQQKLAVTYWVKIPSNRISLEATTT